MKPEVYSRVVVNHDIPGEKLQWGDVETALNILNILALGRKELSWKSLACAVNLLALQPCQCLQLNRYALSMFQQFVCQSVIANRCGGVSVARISSV